MRHEWPNLDRVIRCLEQVETGGVAESERDRCVGDGGRALGRLQIHVVAVDDCNRIMGRLCWTAEDRADPVRARDMCGVYLRHWGARLTPTATATPSIFARNLARIWNGGPFGWQRGATEGYARKFDAVWKVGTRQ